MTFQIDDITWNDLSMDQVCEKINTARSSVGQEYLVKTLRTLLLDEKELAGRAERVSGMGQRPELAARLQKIYKDLGKTKKISLYDYIFRFNEIEPKGNALHYILAILLIAAIVLVFLRPVIGIIALVVMFVINISVYFKYKAAIEGYFMCFKYLVRMIQAASRILKTDLAGEEAFQGLIEGLRTDVRELAPIRRGSWLLTNSVSGSLVDVVMDYVRMLLHVDIIRFNSMQRLAAEKSQTIDHLFCTLGEIETDICISSFRTTLDHWCLPVFRNEEDRPSLRITGMYHPLTPTVVTNDITVNRSVLLTGSNASGKSTFLKQLAINQILAQTISTCLAQEYETAFCKVMSSMALTDNILNGESYFIVEIRSLKRIFDEIGRKGQIPVMCFIDEVLRGTNTKERIAASSQILKQISGMNALCFAATHDIELTRLLEGYMDNYHFEEYVEGNDVRFDYQLKEGPARTRNAIRLMKAYGFDPSITEAAEKMAQEL